jgi:hypothetical protein
MSQQQPVEPITASIVSTGAPLPAGRPATITYVTTSDDGPSEAQKAKAVKEVTGVGLAVIIAIVIVVIFVVVIGLRLIEKMVSGVMNIIGPATECGMQIASKEQAYRNQGMTQCDAYIKAMNEVAVAPNMPCPSPTGHPPASAGVYAQYLVDIGCTPPKPSGS